MGPISAVISCYINILNFSGRARRAEYWWFFLFLVLAGMAVQFGFIAVLWRDPEFIEALQDPVRLNAWLKESDQMLTYTAYAAVAYIVFAWLPQLAVTVRRLHDTNRSGWFFFMPLGVAVLAGIAGGIVAAAMGNAAGLSLMLLILCLPVIASLWFLVVLCLPGTQGTNRFGPDPIKGRKRRTPDHPAFAQAIEPEERAAREAARRAEIAEYYRKNVAPKARRV
ncbi:DUF805 domain-containing protein [Roseicyclus mahoneyensis]|uniref:Uncharacterized membrane protein YhaH (DUF805 family) n=1 Tax=Roseicyclus mahoneyensis TaxID=164332 RepID=A0A316GG14_9RHOB|nr:DUF805 domain-containing protein [Roseicyclus mahoneyensis]PWK59890.1 uncharacterized membrane protein YhaH (DUF805 family) [Roseicyclus mahoneyensis]